MIWFILAALIVVAVTAIVIIVEPGYALEAGVATLALAAALSLVINMGIGAFIDGKPVVTTEVGLLGPVRIINTADDGLVAQATGVNRQTYSSSYGVNIKFQAGDKRKVIITDYQPGHPWLSVFNFRDDDMTFQIPQSEKVALDR